VFKRQLDSRESWSGKERELEWELERY